MTSVERPVGRSSGVASGRERGRPRLINNGRPANRNRQVAIGDKRGLVHMANPGNSTSGILSDQVAQGLRPLTTGEEKDGDGKQYTRLRSHGVLARSQPSASAPLWPPSGVDRSVADAARTERGQEEEGIGGMGLADQVERDMSEQAAPASNFSARVRPSLASFMSPPGSIDFRLLGAEAGSTFLVVDGDSAGPEDEARQARF